MFKIEKSTIHCSRGDKGTIVVKVPITDTKGYIKYEDGEGNYYWYNVSSKILYNSDYKESDIEIKNLKMILYKFKKGDKITFCIYNKNGYTNEALVKKEVIINNDMYNAYIFLNESETTFYSSINKLTIFWYDITLNDSITLVGYDEDGAKEFILYPAKSQSDVDNSQVITEIQDIEEEEEEKEKIKIIDNLESTDIFAALSANQGNILKCKIENTNQTVDNLTKEIENTNQTVDNLTKEIENTNQTVDNLANEIKDWTPVLIVREENEEQPEIEYSAQIGHYSKFGKFVWINFYLRGKIKTLNGVNNYAAIKGVPYKFSQEAIGMSGVNVGTVYNAIEGDPNITFIGYLDSICIQRSNGATATKLKTTDDFIISRFGNILYR